MDNRIFRLNPECKLVISNNKGVLLLCKPYCNNPENNSEHYRISYITALIINNLDGRHTVNEVAQILGHLFNQKDKVDYLESRVCAVICMFEKAFDALSTKDILVKRIYSDEYIIKTIAYYDKSEFKLQRLSFPRQIVMRITNLCDKKCIYCYQCSYKNESDLEYLTMDRMSDILKEAAGNGTENLIVTGGEPFVRKDIYKIIEMASNQKLKVFVSTKRALSQEQLQLLFFSGISELQFSVDTNNTQILQKLTGGNTDFSEYLSSIKMALKLNINVIVKAVITSLNIKTIPLYVEELQQIGVKHIKLNYYELNCKSNDFGLLPDISSMKWLDDNMKIICKRAQAKIEYDYDMAKMILDKKYRDLHRKRCLAFKDTIYIREDGKVSFCEMLMDYPEFIVGDLRTHTILDIWNSNEIDSYIVPDKTKFENTVCYTCHDFYTCFEKRCFMRTYAQYHKKFMPDPWCNKYEN
ncbi:MAG: radical SAM protein [Clostridia bacterium]|nr:radical SAM protein [Clostridia bacterium]